MDWSKLKSKIYYSDGSLRDILVFNTTKTDWQTWANFVNKNYKTDFHIYETDITKEKVDLSKIFAYWDGFHDNCSNATVFIDKIQIKTYFFDDKEIENDITPKEINSINDHYNLIKYMSGLSKALDKKVVMTPENTPKIILISVDKDDVNINLGD